MKKISFNSIKEREEHIKKKAFEISKSSDEKYWWNLAQYEVDKLLFSQKLTTKEFLQNFFIKFYHTYSIHDSSNFLKFVLDNRNLLSKFTSNIRLTNETYHIIKASGNEEEISKLFPIFRIFGKSFCIIGTGYFKQPAIFTKDWNFFLTDLTNNKLNDLAILLKKYPKELMKGIVMWLPKFQSVYVDINGHPEPPEEPYRLEDYIVTDNSILFYQNYNNPNIPKICEFKIPIIKNTSKDTSEKLYKIRQKWNKITIRLKLIKNDIENNKVKTEINKFNKYLKKELSNVQYNEFAYITIYKDKDTRYFFSIDKFVKLNY